MVANVAFRSFLFYGFFKILCNKIKKVLIFCEMKIFLCKIFILFFRNFIKKNKVTISLRKLKKILKITNLKFYHRLCILEIIWMLLVLSNKQTKKRNQNPTTRSRNFVLCGFIYIARAYIENFLICVIILIYFPYSLYSLNKQSLGLATSHFFSNCKNLYKSNRSKIASVYYDNKNSLLFLPNLFN